MHRRLALVALLALPFTVSAQTVFINETFDDLTDVIGSAPVDPALRRTALVAVAAGSGPIGTDQVLHFNDNISGTGGAGVLEYNVGGAAQSTLYVQFDLFNNAPSGTGTGSNPIIFGIGAWNDTSGSATLGSNAARAIGVEFYMNGDASTLRLRSGSSTLGSNTVYNVSAVQTVKLWINDHQTDTLSYIRPDNYQSATLNTNSVVIWVNDVLIGGGSDSGFALASTFTTDVNASLGRVGFNTTTTALADFYIDNLYVATTAPIPEPSTYAVLVGLGALGLVILRRCQTVA